MTTTGEPRGAPRPRSRSARPRRSARLLALGAAILLGAAALTGCQPDPRGRGMTLINSSREAHGRGPVFWDERQGNEAQRHARAMASAGFLYHSDLNLLAGECAMAENVAVAGSVDAAHIALLNSPGHKANMLNPRYDHAGTGVVVAHGRTWYVQRFLDRC